MKLAPANTDPMMMTVAKPKLMISDMLIGLLAVVESFAAEGIFTFEDAQPAV